MLKNLSFLALAGAMTFAATACVVVTDDTSTGETGSGDGDGDATGDGDGDATGDGDGDATGDGDGDATTGDGDGDPTTGGGALCGWDPNNGYYECGFEGADPSGTAPIECPPGLVEGDPCETTGLTGQGCCDADGNNWYCGESGGTTSVVLNPCS